MGTRGNVLVMDASQERAESLTRRLSGAGYNVTNIDSLEEMPGALARNKKLDVALCDMELASSRPEGITSELRNISESFPVVMLSDQLDVAHMTEALRLGASDFFPREPIDEEVLLRAVDRCVRQRRLHRELQSSRQRLEVTNTELREAVKVLRQDQQAGRQVQLRMLPATPLELDQYVFSHVVIPSLYLSGDFTDYFTVGKDHVTFLMADVSGHGSSSAFATVMLKNLFARKRSDFLRRNDDTVMSPVAMLKRANAELLDLGVDKFATMIVALLDRRRNTLRYSVAGHLPQPVLVSPEGVRYLRGEGSAVGMMEDAQYEEHMIELPSRFMLALFSDGILEILPEKNLVDKEKYFLQVFEQSADSPEQVMAHLGLDNIEAVPDDIAALFLSKRG